jgi:hypothetical protein
MSACSPLQRLMAAPGRTRLFDRPANHARAQFALYRAVQAPPLLLRQIGNELQVNACARRMSGGRPSLCGAPGSARQLHSFATRRPTDGHSSRKPGRGRRSATATRGGPHAPERRPSLQALSALPAHWHLNASAFLCRWLSSHATALIGLPVPPLIFRGKPMKRKRPLPTSLSRLTSPSMCVMP